MKSPCINICKIGDKGLCEGCFRTLEEISGWSQFTEEQKLDIIEQCLIREE